MTTCPRCGSDLVGAPAFVRWCEHCDWNVDPLHILSVAVGKAERASVARAGELYEAALVDGPDELPRRGASLALFVLVLPMLVFHLLALVSSIVVLTGSASFVWRFVVGAPLAFLGLMPVLHRVAHADRAVRLAPGEHEELFATVAEIARATGSRPPRRIEVTDRWLVAVLLDSRRTLEIGLPLWASLRPEERRAVLAQQICSLRRRRNLRRRFDAACVRMVSLWAGAFRLDYTNRRAVGPSPQMRAEWRIAAHAEGGAPQVTQRKMLFRWPFEVWSRLVARATEHESWCAVYRADGAAASLASCDAVAGAISVARSAGPLYEARTSQWQRQPLAATWWPRIRELAVDVPATERRRWMRAAELATDQEPFGALPPDGWRLAVMRSHGVAGSRPTALSAVGIDDALSAPAAQIASMLIDGSGRRRGSASAG